MKNNKSIFRLLCFATPSDLKRCIEKCDGMDLNGRKIKMIDDSQAGRSRSRSNSRSRSRSRSRDRRRSRSRSSSRSKSRSRSPPKRSRRESKSKSRSRSRSRSADNRYWYYKSDDLKNKLFSESLVRHQDLQRRSIALHLHHADRVRLRKRDLRDVREAHLQWIMETVTTKLASVPKQMFRYLINH